MYSKGHRVEFQECYALSNLKADKSRSFACNLIVDYARAASAKPAQQRPANGMPKSNVGEAKKYRVPATSANPGWLGCFLHAPSALCRPCATDGVPRALGGERHAARVGCSRRGGEKCAVIERGRR